MKNSNDTIGNRTRDLLTCSAMPQPTAPPRSPLEKVQRLIMSEAIPPQSVCLHAGYKGNFTVTHSNNRTVALYVV